MPIPGVTLAALAHPGLNSGRLRRLVEQNHLSWLSGELARAHYRWTDRLGSSSCTFGVAYSAPSCDDSTFALHLKQFLEVKYQRHPAVRQFSRARNAWPTCRVTAKAAHESLMFSFDAI